jgi:predicted dehydrogenase
MSMNVVVVGCGLAGRKRAAALGSARLLSCADTDMQRANSLAMLHPGCVAHASWQHALAHPELTLAIVATTHDALAVVAEAAIRRGLHVLVEKPGARRADELQALATLADRNGVKLHVGYNHRFHPALSLAHALAAEGRIGSLTHLRASYVHGGRPGYDQEWRFKREVSGGGELLDQGSHLIDLAAWFLGPLQHVSSVLTNAYWSGEVEDNAFLLLQTAGGQVAQLHASWTEWKNKFCFELFGTLGKIEVSGLGGSYGPERLTLSVMRPEMGPPDQHHWEFLPEDVSWAQEFEAFLSAIVGGGKPEPGPASAVHVLELVGRAYAHGQERPS